MQQRYEGPEFMRDYFYPCPHDLGLLLPEYSVHQGIQCICGQKQLSLSKRQGHPAVFAHCKSCGSDFEVYANDDYPAGYVPDDPTKSLKPVVCSGCGGVIFQVGVGYEYPGDETDSTDITWFTLVGRCLDCGRDQELLADETG